MKAENNKTYSHDLAGKRDFILIAAITFSVVIIAAIFLGVDKNTISEEGLRQLRAALLEEGMSGE